VTLLHKIRPGVFGLGDMDFSCFVEDMLLARMMLLFPTWDEHPVEGKMYCGRMFTEVFANARMHIKRGDLTGVTPFEQHLNQIEMPQTWKGILRLLLVPNLEQRPSASRILGSQQYKDMVRAALMDEELS
jgi:hypothetical protein